MNALNPWHSTLLPPTGGAGIAARGHLQHPQGRARRGTAQAAGDPQPGPGRRGLRRRPGVPAGSAAVAQPRGAALRAHLLRLAGSRARPSSWRPRATTSPTAPTPSRAGANTATRCCRAGRSATSVTTTSATTASSSAACCTCRCRGTAPRCTRWWRTSAWCTAAACARCSGWRSFIEAEVPAGEMLVVAGDFNDWGERWTTRCASSACSAPWRPGNRRTDKATFPSLAPVFALDRFYLRGLSLPLDDGAAWRGLGAHVGPPAAGGRTRAALSRDRARRRPRPPAQLDQRPGAALRRRQPGRTAGGRRRACFARMCQAIDAAAGEVWLATYIFHDDPAARAVADALKRAAARGVAVHVVVDGFGSHRHAGTACATCSPAVACNWRCSARSTAGMRGCSRASCAACTRSCACATSEVAFVGGINIIDDRHDMNHGWIDAPRLDYAVELRGPLVASVHATARAMWARAHLWHSWRDEVRAIARSARPAKKAMSVLRELRGATAGARRSRATRRCAPPSSCATTCASAAPSSAATSRPSAMRARASTSRCPTSTPAAASAARCATPPARRARAPAAAGQGRLPHRRAGGAGAVRPAASCRRAHLRIHAGLPARQGGGGRRRLGHRGQLQHRPAVAAAQPGGQRRGARRRLLACAGRAFRCRRSRSPAEVTDTPVPAGWRGWLQRALVAWVAALYLRVAGITGRY